MRAVINGIDIPFAFCAVAGMKAFRRLLCFGYSYVPGQHGIKYEWQLFGGDAGLRVEVQRKAQRVDPGIGAAAPLDIGAAVEHRFQPILKGLGHAPPVGLHLKAAVVGAVVGKGQ